ncbi:hypothetical protein D3C87_2004640 [compost metagenome]
MRIRIAPPPRFAGEVGAFATYQSMNLVKSPIMPVQTPKSSSRPERVRPAFTLTSYWT